MIFWEKWLSDCKSLQILYNVIALVLYLFAWKLDNAMLIVFVFCFCYNAIIITFYCDTKTKLFLDREDNLIIYIIRFFPLQLIVYMSFFQGIAEDDRWYKTLLLFFVLVLTRNKKIKEEYLRYFFFFIYVVIRRGDIFNDIQIIIFLLLWYFSIEKYNYKIVKMFSKKIYLLFITIYCNYFLLKKIIIIGWLCYTIIFSVPFILFYFFDLRILGIVLINMFLTTIFVSRLVYIHALVYPQESLEMAKQSTLEECDLFFSQMTTLLSFENEVIDMVMPRLPWVVYTAYEDYRAIIREVILLDISRIEKEEMPDLQKKELEEKLTKFYEQGERPYEIANVVNYISYSTYMEIEKIEYFKSLDTESLNIVLLATADLEVKVKNPVMFLGFFTESKFFLHK